jgi:hypothetical protein
MADPEMGRCLDDCLSCLRSCLETVTYCLTKGGRHAEVAQVRTLLDCVDICDTSARFLGRRSPLHLRTCAACADVCRTCESSCRRLPEDEVMQRCANACRICAESCEAMVSTA